VPRIAFINKIDRVGADFDGVVEQICTKLGGNAWPVLAPLGKESMLRGQIDIVEQKAIIYPGDGNRGIALAVEPVGKRKQGSQGCSHVCAAASPARRLIARARNL
jgi:elongation factor G